MGAIELQKWNHNYLDTLKIYKDGSGYWRRDNINPSSSNVPQIEEFSLFEYPYKLERFQEVQKVVVELGGDVYLELIGDIKLKYVKVGNVVLLK